MNLMIQRRQTFAGNTAFNPDYLLRAADSFKAQLALRNIPVEALAFSVDRSEMPVIEISVSDAALQARVISALKLLDGAIPLAEADQINFKVARVRVHVRR